jgi:hypoxanthine-DNA glycosylase
VAAISRSQNSKAIPGAVTSKGFPPLARVDAKFLVLGSLPGMRSIQEQQYYAHPRNAFWPIMKALFGVDGEYESRRRQLIVNRIAVWDVLNSAVRPGSLDADIRLDVARANDFEAFFSSYPDIGVVIFNGKKAESLFMRFVEARPNDPSARFILLPSTSPAYAAMPYSGKLARWREAFGLKEDVNT